MKIESSGGVSCRVSVFVSIRLKSARGVRKVRKKMASMVLEKKLPMMFDKVIQSLWITSEIDLKKRAIMISAKET